MEKITANMPVTYNNITGVSARLHEHWNNFTPLGIRSKCLSTSTKELGVGLVFPISYFQKENKFGELPEFGESHFGEDFEDKSQVDFNTDMARCTIYIWLRCFMG